MSQTGCLIAEGITNSMKRRKALLLGNKSKVCNGKIAKKLDNTLKFQELISVKNYVKQYIKKCIFFE